MASVSITSREIDGKTVETVSDFIFWGSKITADGDLSHEKTWRKLKWILFNERSQSEKATYIRFQQYDILEKAKLWRQ